MIFFFFFQKFKKKGNFVFRMTKVPVPLLPPVLPPLWLFCPCFASLLRSIILIFLPSPFHVFFLTIIPSIKPGWPPWCCWRALSVSCRTWCWEDGGGLALAAEGELRSNRVTMLRFCSLSLGQEGQTARMTIAFSKDSTWIQIQEHLFLFVSHLWISNQPLSKFSNYRSHKNRWVVAG